LLPFLDALQNLDFDFEKCCSVTLTHVNVYVCLVCGKYYQVCCYMCVREDATGRGKLTNRESIRAF